MSKLIGSPSDKSFLDEMIENTREANAEFLKEIEKEKLEAERKAKEDEALTKQRQKEGFAEIDKRLDELADPDYKPKPHKVDVFPPSKPAPIIINPGIKPKKKHRIHSEYKPYIYGLLGGVGLSALITIPIAYTDLNAAKAYFRPTMECVEASTRYGFFALKENRLKACNDGYRELTIDAGGQGYRMINMPGDELVDRLVVNNAEYTRENNKAMLEQADRRWVEEWKEIGADNFLERWESWKKENKRLAGDSQ